MAKYKPINSVGELSSFCEEDKDNVGVTRSGDLYSYDFEKGKAIKLSLEVASEQLGLSHDIMAELIKLGGHYIVPEPIHIAKEEAHDEVEIEENLEVKVNLEKEESSSEEEVQENLKVKVDIEKEESLVEKQLDPLKLKIEVVFQQQVAELIKPLIKEISDLKSQLESQLKLATLRYKEFLEFKNNILL